MSYEFQVQPAYTELTDVSSYDYINRFLAGNIGMFYCGDWCLSLIHISTLENSSRRLEYSPLMVPTVERAFPPRGD